MKKILLSTMVFAGLLFGSCTSEESVINNNETTVSSKSNSSNEELRNVDYEQIGIHHNEGLDYIISMTRYYYTLLF